MTRHAAWKKANGMWRHLGFTYVKVKRKTVVDRFEVGYHVSPALGGLVIMGAGPSWEVAFERASKVAP